MRWELERLRPGIGSRVELEPTLTIRPQPRSRIPGTTAPASTPERGRASGRPLPLLDAWSRAPPNGGPPVLATRISTGRGRLDLAGSSARRSRSWRRRRTRRRRPRSPRPPPRSSPASGWRSRPGRLRGPAPPRSPADPAARAHHQRDAPVEPRSMLGGSIHADKVSRWAPVAQWSTVPSRGPKSVGLSSRRSRVRFSSGASAKDHAKQRQNGCDGSQEEAPSRPRSSLLPP